MFGCLVSGRIVQTNAQQVDANRFIFALEKANQVQHVALFLLGTVPLPEGYGASIFFGWPPYQDWKYLGYIANVKPSAIFRLHSRSNTTGATPSAGAIDIDMGAERSDDVVAQIGISIEPLAVIEKRHQESTANTNRALVVSTPSSNASAVTPQDVQNIGLKMCENLFNYLKSFASNATSDMIPSAALDKWYENFQRKLKMDPFFWKNG